MYEVIVATHGRFAEGLKDTMNMIVGEREKVYFIEFLQNDQVETLREKLQRVICSIDDEHQILVLTDLFGGTPCNVASKIALESTRKINVLCGVNLPMLVEAVFNIDNALDQVIDSILDASKQGIVSINLSSQISMDDE